MKLYIDRMENGKIIAVIPAWSDITTVEVNAPTWVKEAFRVGGRTVFDVVCIWDKDDIKVIDWKR